MYLKVFDYEHTHFEIISLLAWKLKILNKYF